MQITPVLLSLSWLLFMNVLLLVFNLVPAFPLDGGRIARSIVWRVSGDKVRGTRVAAKMGQAFALILAGVGLWLLLSYKSFSGLWLVALSFLLCQSARGALVQTAFNEQIEGVTVSDVMDPQPVAIPAETPVGQALDEYFVRYGWDWFPVIDDSGHLLGIARRAGSRRPSTAARTGSPSAPSSTPRTPSAGRSTRAARSPRSSPRSRFGKLGAVMAVDREGSCGGSSRSIGYAGRCSRRSGAAA